MTPFRAALCLNAILIPVFLAGCGNESGSPSPDPVSPQPSVAVYLRDDARSIDVLMQKFQSATGIGYSYISRDSAEPMSRADVFFGESFVELWEMAEADLLRPVAPSLNERVAAGQLTDPERRFIPLAMALRAVVFNENLVSEDEIRTITGFASLADDRWQGRLCLSSARVDGNRLLVAHLIKQHGVRDAEIMLRRWLQNLAAAGFDDDAGLFAAISAGECALGVLDIRLISSAAPAWTIGFHSFPDADTWLFDIAGAGISRHATSPANAVELLDWLLTADGNEAYRNAWPELPLSRESVQRRTETSAGPALARAESLSELGFLLEEADLLVERAGYR